MRERDARTRPLLILSPTSSRPLSPTLQRFHFIFSRRERTNSIERALLSSSVQGWSHYRQSETYGRKFICCCCCWSRRCLRVCVRSRRNVCYPLPYNRRPSSFFTVQRSASQSANWPKDVIQSLTLPLMALNHSLLFAAALVPRIPTISSSLSTCLQPSSRRHAK